MNHSDSERISGFLESQGYKSAESISEASLVIFNTCGVRQMAEDRVYGQIHNLKTKDQRLKTKVVLTGCLANRKDVQRRLKDKVDLFFPINDFKSI
jgi:tRNA-2-methylthio-N6-dimethylallyladenosine synthase